jgi:hypothetical protein
MACDYLDTRTVRLCVPRYIMERRIGPPEPEPDPFRTKFINHDPVIVLAAGQIIPAGQESWLKGGRDASLGQDLSAVATLRRMANQLLSPAMRKAGDAAMATLVAAVQERLPEGARFEPANLEYAAPLAAE